MRKLYFLVPGLGGKYRCGGLFAELKTWKLARQICPAEVVTYRQREPATLFLQDLLQEKNLTNLAFVLSWGFDVPWLARQLSSYPLLYHAHSTGYNFSLPAQIPILTVSRHSLGYWGQKAPHSLLYCLPNHISEEFVNLQLERDIDILVQVRKSSEYLLSSLLPELQKHCRVEVVDRYVEDLAALFNRTKIYLYDSAEYWAQQRVSEGFGLQPLEAIACGCQVFSSVNGGLADYLDPGFNCQKIAGYALEFDRDRILRALQNPHSQEFSPLQLAEYRQENLLQRLGVILQDVNDFWDALPTYKKNIPPLTKVRLLQLQYRSLRSKIQQKLKLATRSVESLEMRH